MAVQPRSARPVDLLTVAAAGTVFVVGARAARRPEVSSRERRWFTIVNRLPSAWRGPVWVVMQLGSLGGVVATTAAAVAAGRPVAARRIGSAGLLAWIGAKGLKRFVGRGRPASIILQTRIVGREQSGLGYPSGHAAVTAAIALSVASEASSSVRRSVWLVPLVVGGSRLYVGAHLPLDVVGGVALGVACGGAVRLATPRPSPGRRPVPRAERDAARGAGTGRQRPEARR